MNDELRIRDLREAKEILDKHGIIYWLDFGSLLGAVREGRILKWDNDIDLGIIDIFWNKLISILPEFEEKGFSVRVEKFKIFEDLFLKSFILHRNIMIDFSPYSINSGYALHCTAFPCSNIGRGLSALDCLLLLQKTKVSPKFKIVERILGTGLYFVPYRQKKSFSHIIQSLAVRWKSSALRSYRVYCWVIPKHYFEKLHTIEMYGVTFNIPSDAEDYLKYHYGENWKIPKKNWLWYRDDGSIRDLGIIRVREGATTVMLDTILNDFKDKR